MPNILVVGRGETKYVRDKFWASSNEDVFTFCREITSKWLCLSEPQFSALSVVPYPLCGVAGWLKWESLGECAFKSQEGPGSMGRCHFCGGKLKVAMRHMPVSAKWSIRNGSPKRCGGVEQRGRKLGFSSLLWVSQIFHPRAPWFPFL